MTPTLKVGIENVKHDYEYPTGPVCKAKDRCLHDSCMEVSSSTFLWTVHDLDWPDDAKARLPERKFRFFWLYNEDRSLWLMDVTNVHPLHLNAWVRDFPWMVVKERWL